MNSVIVILPYFFPLLRSVMFPKAVTAVNVHKHSLLSFAYSSVSIIVM